MKPVTEREVARLLDGRVDDPHEAERIVQAIERDPRLAALADLLSDPMDDAEDDLPQPAADPFLFPDLSRTRLCRLRPQPELQQVADGTGCTAEVEYERDGRIDVFPLKMQPDGDLIRVEAKWPDGLRPVGFVLAQFDHARGREPHANDKFSLPERKAQPRAEGTARTGQARMHQAAASTGECRTGSDESVNSKHFHADLVGTHLHVNGRLKGRDVDVVIVEVTYHPIGTQKRTIRFPVRLERRTGNFSTAHVTDFPWPDDAAHDQAYLTVRPLTDEDLPLLPGPDVSALLAAAQEEFVPLPILPDDDGGLRAKLLDPAQQAVMRDHRTGWYLRMEEKGGPA